MPLTPPPGGWRSQPGLDAFGAALRAARGRAAVSQMQLEGLSEVDQSMISRIENARAPNAALYKVVLLGSALGNAFPLGSCPHHHVCSWRPPGSPRPVMPTALSRLLDHLD